MDYKKFNQLLQKGECKTIDYKIQCNALTKGNEKSTAELVKDIIAFANNGNIVSYLIIGVSDDRNGFKSVDNQNLTDDNLQTLCRDYIFPIPKVKLLNCCWNNTIDERHKGINFVIIQVGSQSRQCFRFNRDCINYEQKYCFKKSEVWIRREATSDLAIPEEIKKLLEGKEPIGDVTLENITDFTRLPSDEYKNVIRKELSEFIKELNGSVERIPGVGKYKNLNWYRLNINVFHQNLKIVILITDKCNTRGYISKLCRDIPILHHGVMIVSVGNVSPTSLEWNHLKIKEKWGWFCCNSDTRIGRLINTLPTNEEGFKLNSNETFCIALEKIKDSQALFDKLHKAIESLIVKDDIRSYVSSIYETNNRCLHDWRNAECIIRTEKKLSDYYINKLERGQQIKIVEKDEFVDIKKYGNVVMKKKTSMLNVIDKFLE